MFSYSPKKVHFAVTNFQINESPVNPHLAYTLSEVSKMIQKGQPVSQTNLINSYYDGSENCSCDIPSDMRRGVDINDMWNEALSQKRTLSKLKSSSIDFQSV